MFSTAPAGGLIPLVPTRFTEVHISSPVSTPVPAGKRPPEDTRVAVFPSLCTPQERPVVATRKTTGDLATRGGAGDPETRAEWMMVLRHGRLWSAPVAVDAGYARSGNRLHSLQRSVNSTRFAASPMVYRLSDDAHTCLQFVAVQNIAACSQFRPRTSRAIQSAVHVQEVTGPEDHEGCTLSRWTARIDISSHTLRGVDLVFACDSRLRTSPRLRGLWTSTRHPVSTGQKGVSSRRRNKNLCGNCAVSRFSRLNRHTTDVNLEARVRCQLSEQLTALSTERRRNEESARSDTELMSCVSE